MSKIPIASHVSGALDGFVEHSVTAEDLDAVLTVMEKASLRSPEVALPGKLITRFTAHKWSYVRNQC